MSRRYRIVSQWDGLMSSLHGEEYETYEDALADCRRVGPGDLVTERVDHGNELAWLVYASGEDCARDVEGRANNAIARIETVSDREDER